MKIAREELPIKVHKPNSIQNENNFFWRQCELEKLQPFVSLELLSAVDLHQISVATSGKAIITYVLAGEALFADSTGNRGTLQKDDWSWVISGNGICYSIEALTPDFLCIQLGIALSPALENSAPQSSYVRLPATQFNTQVQVLIGWHEQERSQFAFPSGINYLAVHLKAGEQWSYELPLNHKFSWASVASGQVKTISGKHKPGDLIYLERDDKNLSVCALADSIIVVGSAIEFGYDLVFHENSVHTSPESLQESVSGMTAARKAIIDQTFAAP